MTSYEKRKKRNLISLLVILALMVVAVIAVPFILKEDEVIDTVEGTFYVTNLTKSDIIGVRYEYYDEDEKENVDRSYIVEDGKWYYAEDKNLPIAQGTFDVNIIQNIYKIEAGRKLEEVQELKKYGLDEPKFKLYITLKNDHVVEVLGGNYNEVMNGTYFMKKGDSNVYLVGGSLEKTFYQMCKPNVYEYATLDTMPSITSDALQFITAKNGTHRYEITYKPDGVKEDLVASSYWYFQDPFPRLTGVVDDKFEGALDIVMGINYHMLADYEATEEELVAYGLKDSDKFYALTYWEKDAETNEIVINAFKLVIGGLDKTGKYYYVQPVYIKDTIETVSNKISLVSKDSVDACINLDPLDYSYRYPAYVGIENLVGGGMTVTAGGKSYKIDITEHTEIKNGAEKVIRDYTYNGTLFDENQSTLMRDFYKEYMLSFVKQIIYDESKIKEINPILKFEYNITGNDAITSMVVEYSVYDDDYYQVTVDGKTSVLVSRPDIDKALAIFTELSATIK